LVLRRLECLHGQSVLFAEEFDGNDHHATHFIGFIKGEPAGCIRARFFHDFVKLERLAVLKGFRESSSLSNLSALASIWRAAKAFDESMGIRAKASKLFGHALGGSRSVRIGTSPFPV